ncbi:MAG: FliO/MopB family protein [Pseudomonadota bacterium]|jgi:hypothetical protein
MQSALGFFFAMVVVLALIGAAAWLVRRFAGNRLGATAKGGRLPRLAVIDAIPVDGRRRLVMVRRDNVEHLLMIGGPTDIVVEPNIVRAMPARDTSRSPSLPDPASWAESEPPRPESLDFNEPPMPEPPPRPARPSFIEEARRPPAMPERRERSAPDMGSFAPEPMARPAPELRPEPPVRPRSEQIARSEPMMPRPARPEPKAPPVRAERPVAAPLAPAAPAAAAPAASADQNLAEMAQRLEAALRQPGRDPRPSPPVAPDAPAARPARTAAPEVKIDPPAETSSAPPVAPPKASFEDLEEEMASLLGRPKPPT